MVVDCIMDFVRQLFGNTKTIRDKLNTEECLVPYDHALGCLYALLTTTSALHHLWTDRCLPGTCAALTRSGGTGSRSLRVPPRSLGR